MRSFGIFSAVLLWLAVAATPFAQAFEIRVANAPDTTLSLAVSTLRDARKSIYLNIYELTSPELTSALVDRIQAGVHVEILEEGQPVGGLSAEGRAVQTRLTQAMRSQRGGDHLYEMTSKTGGHRRYRYDHAKYAVIDDTRLLIGSENYSPTGHPLPGGVGNRGWEVLIDDPAITRTFRNIFAQDADLSAGDLRDLVTTAVPPAHPRLTPPTGPAPGEKSPERSGDTLPSFEASGVQPITSPNTSLSGLQAMIAGATRTLDIEQMTFDSGWGSGGGASPLYKAVVAAARRGVRVRVLLNDERVFSHGAPPARPINTVTAAALNRLATDEDLDVAAKIADLQAMGVDYIHNKGALVDDDRTLISSINWGENSVEHNREAAVLITSAGVHGFYGALFEADWNASSEKGLANQALPGCLDSDGAALPVMNEQVLAWKHTTPNQFLHRALVTGTIDRIFPDHSGHKHFEVKLGDGPEDGIELVYNESFGALPALRAGDPVEACGDYITSTAQSGAYPPSPSGAIIHWIHQSPKPAKHPSGFVAVNGTVYGELHGHGGALALSR